VGLDPRALGPAELQFLTERHLATLTTVRADGSLHVVAVGFTYEPETATVRVITSAGSAKVAHVERAGTERADAPRAAVGQVDGPRWLSLEGVARVSHDPGRIADAVRRYALRYRDPRPNPERVVIEIAVDRALGRG
jgi:PPOX class probable F420-dependent enzyme